MVLLYIDIWFVSNPGKVIYCFSDMVPVHGDKFEGNTSMQGANYESDILSAQIVVWVFGFTALWVEYFSTLPEYILSFRVIASILILKSMTSMVQKLKSFSSFDLPIVYQAEEDDELESVECFSVDSLDTDRKTLRHNSRKDSCKQNGYKI